MKPRYSPAGTDDEGKANVFPVFKNFYAGGLGSIRGFEQSCDHSNVTCPAGSVTLVTSPA